MMEEGTVGFSTHKTKYREKAEELFVKRVRNMNVVAKASAVSQMINLIMKCSQV